MPRTTALQARGGTAQCLDGAEPKAPEKKTNKNKRRSDSLHWRVLENSKTMLGTSSRNWKSEVDLPQANEGGGRSHRVLVQSGSGSLCAKAIRDAVAVRSVAHVKAYRQAKRQIRVVSGTPFGSSDAASTGIAQGHFDNKGNRYLPAVGVAAAFAISGMNGGLAVCLGGLKQPSA